MPSTGFLPSFLSEHLGSVLAVLGYLLTLAFIPVVLIRKRQPSAAIAWCLAIVLLPYLGTLLFLVIGIQRVNRPLRRKLFHRSRFVSQWISTTADELHEDQQHSPPDSAQHWQGMNRLAAAVGGVRVSQGNELSMYNEGNEAFQDKLAAIKQATSHVHAEYYILRDDHTGKELVKALCDKAQQGVEVRLLVDAIGSYGARRLLGQLREAGGQAQFFLPIMQWRRRFVINLRNHRKILICDGKIAFTGGLNIGDEYLGKSKRFGHWRDTQLKVQGPAALGLQRVFVEDWDFAADELLSDQRYFPKPSTTGSAELQVVWSGPDHQVNAIHEVYFLAIAKAQDTLWIATPYFVPSTAILVALKNAALRGVDVRILTQSWPPDNYLAYFAARYHWEELLDAGVRVYQYNKGMIHAKVLCADRSWASVGSANLDVRSLRLNFEVNCLIYSRSHIDQIYSQFEVDFEQSQEVTRSAVESRSIPGQLADNVCRLFSPML